MTKTDDQITNLDAELDALSSPTTADTYVVSKDYDPDVVAASAARRALSGGGGGGGLLSVTVTLDNDAIKALPTVGSVVVVPAPVDGNARVAFLKGEIALRGAGGEPAVSYSNIDAGSVMWFGYSGGIQASVYLVGIANAFETGGNDVFVQFALVSPSGEASVGALNGVVGLPIAFNVSNGELGDFEDGDPGNTLDVTVFYVDVSAHEVIDL